MAYSGFKGIGPNKIGCGSKGSPAKKYGGNKGDESRSKLDYESPAKMYGGKKGDESKSKRDYESPAKNQNKGYGPMETSNSPNKKMNKGMSYDIKEASNQSLSKSARKHYAENAQAANKGGYGNKERG